MRIDSAFYSGQGRRNRLPRLPHHSKQWTLVGGAGGFACALMLALTLAAAVPALAHHAFGGEFDANRPVLLKGKIIKVEWVNPHTWIHMEVVKPDGSKEVWMVEGGSPNALLRHGVTRASLPIGTEIVVDGYQSRDHSLRANGRNITYPDGRKLLLGSSAPDAQNETHQK